MIEQCGFSWPGDRDSLDVLKFKNLHKQYLLHGIVMQDEVTNIHPHDKGIKQSHSSVRARTHENKTK